MKARLLELLGVALPSYFVLLLLAFLVATALGALWARRVGRDPDVVVDLGLSMLVFGVLGARVLHVLADGYFWDYVHLCTDPEQVLWKVTRAECARLAEGDLPTWLGGAPPAPLGRWDEAAGGCRPSARDCFAWARFWAGGLTYYGGLLGASAAAVFQLRRDRFPFWKAADMAGLVVPVGLVYGRMGCLLGGCCFGQPHEGPLSLVFPPHSAASEAQWRAGLLSRPGQNSLGVHPTQLYEAFACLFLAGWLYFFVHPKKRYDGQVLLAFLAGYAALRFAIETLRADPRGALLGLSTSQWLGVVLLGLAIGGHRWLSGRAAAAARIAPDEGGATEGRAGAHGDKSVS
jgi:phosphatidylglycerol:prolipoprotein diacylglycerol transferase